jgi:hypothetical protein
MRKTNAIDATMNLPAFKEEEPLACGTCETGVATHVVSISVRKGLEYRSQSSLYHVDYCVCAACAKDVLEVKLGAKLHVRR